jgi:hypothetical protein
MLFDNEGLKVKILNRNSVFILIFQFCFILLAFNKVTESERVTATITEAVCNECCGIFTQGTNRDVSKD